MTTQTDEKPKISATKQKKIESVNALSDKIQKAKAVVLTDYQGLKHKQLEELRALLKKIDGEFVIAKNRLIKRSLGDHAEAMQDALKGGTAVLFAYKDEVAPIKELLKFFKTSGVGTAKVGILDNAVLTQDEVKRLAALPTREILLGTLVQQLNAPIQGLHYAFMWNVNKLVWALNSIKEKKN